jgi:hypothetical protein
VCESDKNAVVGFLERAVGAIGRFEDRLDPRIGSRYAQDDRISGSGGSDQTGLISSANLTESNGAQVESLLDVLLEGGAKVFRRCAAGKCVPDCLEHLTQIRDAVIRAFTCGATSPLHHGIRFAHDDLRGPVTKRDAIDRHDRNAARTGISEMAAS